MNFKVTDLSKAYSQLEKKASTIEKLSGFSLDNIIEMLAKGYEIKSTADVVPRSECEKWYAEYHKIKEELKQEKIYHRETEKLCDRYFVELEQAKQEVAEQIFEEIDKILKPQEKYLYCNPSLTYVYELITELRKKYIGK